MQPRAGLARAQGIIIKIVRIKMLKKIPLGALDSLMILKENVRSVEALATTLSIIERSSVLVASCRRQSRKPKLSLKLQLVPSRMLLVRASSLRRHWSLNSSLGCFGGRLGCFGGSLGLQMRLRQLEEAPLVGGDADGRVAADVRA